MEEKKLPQSNFNPPWQTKDVLLAFLISFLAFMISAVLLGAYLKGLHLLGLMDKIDRAFFKNTFWGDLLTLFYFTILGLMVYFLILKKIVGSKFKFFIDLSKIKNDIRFAFGVYLLSFLGVTLLGIFIVILVILIALAAKQDPVKWLKLYSEGLDVERAQITAHLGALKIGMLLFIAPLFEEIFFRGCLYSAIRKNHGILFSIFLSAFLFAFLHGYFFNFPNIFVMGLIVAWIYEKRRSLTAPIIFHFLWNFIVLFMFFLSRGNKPV